MISFSDEMYDPASDEYVTVDFALTRYDVDVIAVSDDEGNARPDLIPEAERLLVAGRFERAIQRAIDDDYCRHEPDPDREWDSRVDVE